MALSDFDLVLFGGSGDLAMRKLLPAMFSRDVCGDLPPTARIVCVGRQESTQEEFINMVTTTSRPHIKSAKATDENWNRFIARIVYVALDATDSATYKGLAEALRTDPAITRVYYLATPPALFSRICDNLKENGLATANSRVVLEKPLGRDLASAKQINKEVGKVFEEQQIYRIDHYLGKETVQNLLALRFGNILFEPLWRREWISDVQITIAEKLGVGNRIGYYDTSGALRDMLQNHLLQLLCIVAMEPPTSIAPDAVRDSKLQVLRSLKRFTPTTLAQNIVRGQYRAGHVEGKAVPSYRDEPEAPQNSKTETFVAMKVEIDTWRWAGVPFYLRTGKRMPQKLSQIVIHFKEPSHYIFAPEQRLQISNKLIIRLQPDEGISLRVMTKEQGLDKGMQLRSGPLQLNFSDTWRSARIPDAYERLLLEVMNGNQNLFVRKDEIEAAWKWCDQLIAGWKKSGDAPKPYAAGSWGPMSSIALITRDGRSWYGDI